MTGDYIMPLHPDISPPTPKHSVAIIDDDGFMLDYLVMALGKTPYRIDPFDSAERFLDAVGRLPDGIVLTDLKMPGMDGLGLLGALKSMGEPLRPTIIMSAFADIPIAVEAMKAGAVGVLQKPIMPAALLQAVEDAMSLVNEPKTGWAAVRLTGRERQVADQMACGLTSKEIALKLGISHRTVEVFRSSLLRKTNTNNVAALVSLMRSGS